jgi:hypothetical protein
MSKAKQRPSVATIVAKSALEQASVKLQALPDKPKEVWSLRETVALLQDDITSALNRGYTYDEIVKVLADKNIDITVSSLKRYLAAARHNRGDAPVRGKTRQTRKTSSFQAPTVKSPAPPAESTAQPSSSSTPSSAAKSTRQPSAAKTKSSSRSASKVHRKAAD